MAVLGHYPGTPSQHLAFHVAGWQQGPETGDFSGRRRVARPALRYRRRERFAFRDREVATLHLFDNRE
jgi:hypothetical protein